MTSIRNRIATGAAALAITAGAALGATAVGTGSADAAVTSGHYTWTTTKLLNGARGSYPVTVRGTVLTLDIPGVIIGESKHARLHQTRTGAWMDYGGNRYVFQRKGSRYVGQELWLTIDGAVVGTTSLTPRR